MWIQQWSPGRYYKVSWAVWQEAPELYYCFRRSERGYSSFLEWEMTRRIAKTRRGEYYPTLIEKNRLAYGRECFVGRSRELNRLWTELMDNPTPFLVQRAL